MYDLKTLLEEANKIKDAQTSTILEAHMQALIERLTHELSNAVKQEDYMPAEPKTGAIYKMFEVKDPQSWWAIKFDKSLGCAWVKHKDATGWTKQGYNSYNTYMEYYNTDNKYSFFNIVNF